ncbi:hypothetical protein QCA50_005560 [Cerrena zonata]|uniref:Uncharacterized protein n=1 Tax=Cerrena zonata TaxID=2478898 RepID=A0AAW0GKL2_9APHY
MICSRYRFLREDNDQEPLTWEEQLAKKYYDNLYREYAVCDLKHYKSGNFSLRWRTEDEVLSGAGETTCGNTRCSFHDSNNVEEARPSLKTLELPFSYQENGEGKFALVKVVLCNKCFKKLMWKRNKEKERDSAQQAFSHTIDVAASNEGSLQDASRDYHSGEDRRQSHRVSPKDNEKVPSHHRRNSRSQSPPKRHEALKSRRR